MKVCLIGTFGHWKSVVDELDSPLAGFAPALPGETAPPGTPVFEDYRQMLATARPAVVIVSCRLDLIPGIAMNVARLGCDVICEKPLALDRLTLDKLHETVRATGVRLMAMLSLRGDRSFRPPGACTEKAALAKWRWLTPVNPTGTDSGRIGSANGRNTAGQ